MEGLVGALASAMYSICQETMVPKTGIFDPPPRIGPSNISIAPSLGLIVTISNNKFTS